MKLERLDDMLTEQASSLRRGYVRLGFTASAWCLALLVSTLVVATVAAHALLIKSEPEDGSQLVQAPEQVTAWFTQELDTRFSTIQVFNSESSQVDTGDGGVDLFDPNHTSLVVSLPASLPEGAYRVHWTAVSTEDSDLTEGEFTFAIGAGNIAASQSSPTEPTAAKRDEAGWPVVTLGISMGVLILIILGLILKPRLTKRKHG